MLIIAGFIVGALLGGLNARRKKGNRLDIAQYAGVGGIIGALIAMIVTLFLV